MRISSLVFALLISGCASQQMTNPLSVCSSMNECASTITEKISSNWIRPESLIDDQVKLKRMEVSFDIKLNELYDIERIFISSSSGDEEFDNSAFKAIVMSAPFYELSGLPIEEYNRRFKPFFVTFRPEDLIR